MMIYKGTLHPTPPDWQPMERDLLDMTDGHAMLWSGRAATALYHAYQVAAAQQPHLADAATPPEIIMPAMMCTTAAHVALLAGMTPRFADCDPQTGLLSLASVQARTTSKTVAVVAIHLYGQTVDVDPLVDWCREHNMLLIEDLAQALGARYPDGRCAGSAGDMAVYSFNRTKLIEAGGGALITRTAQTTAQLQHILAADLPLSPVAAAAARLQLGLSHRNLHHSLVGLLRLQRVPVETLSQSFLAIQESFAPLYLRDANPDASFGVAWAALDDALARRRQLAEIYTAELQSDDLPWTLLTGYRSSGVCWRYTLLIDSDTDSDSDTDTDDNAVTTAARQVTFSEAVRGDGFHVSNLYWAVDQFFRPADACPHADAVARRVINLWVNHQVDADYVRRCAASLRQHAHLLR